MTPQEKQEAKEKFLKALSNTANVRAACIQAGVDHSTVYRWQEMDEDFGFRFREANKDANWLLFGEAWQRAMKGEEEYVVSGGKLIYGPDGKPLMQRRKSDRMLELLLKARLSEFREKQSIDVNANVTGSVQSDLSSDLRLLTNEQLAQFKTWLQEAKAGQEQ